MTAFLRRLPVPAGCVALGLIGLGTLLGSISPLFLHVFGILSILLQIAVLLKLFLPGTLKAICSDTVTFSTLSGTSMALMLTAAQLKKAMSFPGAVWIWYLGLCLHLLILLLFSCRLLQERPGFSGVRGSWLLVYVGIAAAAISAPAFHTETLGLFLLLPAAIGAVILLPLIYRADLQPVWLAGYLSASSSPSRTLASGLLLLAQLLYLPALIRCIRSLRKAFNPAWAAFTFPFVISASSLKQASALLRPPFAAVLLLRAESMIALILCIYVLYQYLRFLFKPKRP